MAGIKGRDNNNAENYGNQKKNKNSLKAIFAGLTG